MDDKRRMCFRSKRSKPMDEGMWDCSVCTYKNASEAFKCEMCDVRKGTSTRKPRINPQLVAQQVVAQHTPLPPPVKKEKKERDKDDPNAPVTKTSPTAGQKRKSNRPPRLKNIDRSSGTSLAVTVDDVTVIITDYKPKKPRTPIPSESNSSITSSDPPESTQLSGDSAFPPIKDSPTSDTNTSLMNSVPQSSQNGDLESES